MMVMMMAMGIAVGLALAVVTVMVMMIKVPLFGLAAEHATQTRGGSGVSDTV
jgi:hypothetical protein